VFDPAAWQWGPTGDMTSSREGHTAAVLADGRVMVAGGLAGGEPVTTAETYDPSNGQWEPTASMRSARYLHTATPLRNGMVVVVGGWDGTHSIGDVGLFGS
jgi:hypothetical protein